jgi:hypothetical protein
MARQPCPLPTRNNCPLRRNNRLSAAPQKSMDNGQTNEYARPMTLDNASNITPVIHCMSPLTAATTFSTIVGLLRIFRQERGEREKLNHQNFIEWMENHRHEELKNLIVNNAALRTEVDNLLQADHVQMLGKLDHIEEILVSLVSGVDDLRGIALAIAPNASLSEQAILILRQFVDSGDDRLIYNNFGGANFVIVCLQGSLIEVTEPRLIADDLNQLVALQLLTVVEYDSEGRPIYGITRNAVRFMEVVDGKPSS